VAAAVEASEQRAEVRLVAPRTYLGEDLCATLRLWLEEDETPAGPLRLADTHLHAAYADGGGRDDYAGERLAQVVELAHGLRDRSTPLLAVGDFNMQEGSEAYAVWQALSGTSDVAAALDARRPTVQAGHHYVNDHTEDKRIDYVFARTGADASLRPVSIERVLDGPVDLGGIEGRYSDHHGLSVEVELATGSPNAAPAHASASATREAIDLARARLEEAAARTESRARSQTRAGVAGLVVSGGAGLLANLRTRERRALLRALALGLPALGALGSGLTVALGSGFSRAEARRFLDVARLLDDFAAR
jgi:hypothetical protein